MQLDPGVQNIALALGVLHSTASGVSVDPAFFGDPLKSLSRIFTVEERRVALVAALDQWLAAVQPAGLGAAGEGEQRSAYPLLRTGLPGQVYIVMTRADAAAASALRVSVVGEVQASGQGPAAMTEMVLLIADGQGLRPVAATKAHPLLVEASAPVSASGARLTARLLIVGPPDIDQSRLVVRLEGAGDAPLEFDISAGAPPLARIASLLLGVLLAQIDPTAAEPVRRLAHTLPTLLGLAEGLPPLPLGDLVRDPDAMRRWMAHIATGHRPDGRSTLVVWMDALGRLMGAPPIAVPWPAGTEDDPAVLTIVAPAANLPMLALTAGVRTTGAGAAKVLVFGVRAALVAVSPVDAALRAHATLLVLPLSGTSPATVMERLDIGLLAPASSAMLLDPVLTNGGFGVRAVHAGLSVRTGGVLPSLEPLIELRDVTLTLAGTARHFDNLDLTDTDALGEAAQSLLNDAIDAGLGAAAPVVQALRKLIGLGTTPGLDLGLLAASPTRAIASYYRALFGTADGWPSLLRAVGQMLGNPLPAVGAGLGSAGSGTLEDPWTVPLKIFEAPAGMPLQLQLALWNEGSAEVPVLALALRVRTGGAAGAVTLSLTLIEAELLAAGGGAMRWLSRLRAQASHSMTALQPAMEGVSFEAASIGVAANWRPGSPITARVDIVSPQWVGADGPQISPALAWPIATAADPASADLGLGIDPTLLWPVLRPLLARAAGTWGSADAREALSLIGIAAASVSYVSPGNSGEDDEAAKLSFAIPPLLLPRQGGLGGLVRDPLAAVRAWLLSLLSAGEANGRAEVQWLLSKAQGLLNVALAADPANLGATAPLRAWPVDGGGCPSNPWLLPLSAPGERPVHAIAWLAPDGPPRHWAQAALNRLNAGDLDGVTLLAMSRDLQGHATWIADALSERNVAAAAAQLDTFGAELHAGDGVLPIELSMPLSPAWISGTSVDAAHHRVTHHAQAVSQVRTWLATLNAGKQAGECATLLIAPRLAGDAPWTELLEGVPATECADIVLRVAGTAPSRVDLGGVAAALWYRVDLADDGDTPRADAVVALDRVVDAVRRVKPGAQIAVVVHSYAALVVERCVVARPALFAGVAALAAPLGAGAPLSFVSTEVAEAVRLCMALAPPLASGATPTVADDVLTLLAARLEGRATMATSPTLTDGMALPLSVWTRTAPPAPWPATVQAMAICAVAQTPLLDAVGQRIAAGVDALPPPAAPVALRWGVRVGLELPRQVSDSVRVDTSLSMTLGGVGLDESASGAGATLDWCARVTRPDGWLVGTAGTGAVQAASIRWAEFSGHAACVAPMPAVGVDIRLHDIGLRGNTAGLATLDDPRSAELLDALLQALDGTSPSGAQAGALLDLLASIGVVRRRTRTVPAAFLADGIQSLRQDAAAVLAARLPALLDRTEGLLGWRRAASAQAGGGPWMLSCDPLPLDCVVECLPWRVSLRTRTALAAGQTGEPGLTIGIAGRLRIDAAVRPQDALSRVFGALSLGGLAFTRASATSPVMLESPWLTSSIAVSPPDADGLARQLSDAVVPLLLNSALTLALEQYFGGGVQVDSLLGLLRSPGQWAIKALSDDAVQVPRAAAVDELLRTIGRVIGLPDTPGASLTLPGGLTLSVAESGSGAQRQLRLTLGSAAPIALWSEAGASATLAPDLRLEIGANGHLLPGGDFALRLPLPAAAGWGAIELRVGADAQGVKLAIATDSHVALQLLPKVSGLDTLVQAAGNRLLPELLDRLVGQLALRTPRPPALDDVLAVADALGVHDASVAVDAGFRARAAQLASFSNDIVAGNLQALAPAIGTAATTLLRRLFGPGMVPTPSAPGRLGVTLGNVAQGTLTVEADFSTLPPGVRVSAQGLVCGAVTADIEAGLLNATLMAAVDLRAVVDTGAGLVFTPRLSAGIALGIAGAQAPRLRIDFRPLGSEEVVIALAPQPVAPTLDQVLIVAEAWLIPLAGTLLLRAAAPLLSRPMWAGGRTLTDVLVAAGLATRSSSGGDLSFIARLPAPPVLLRGVLDGLGGTDIPLPGDFALRLVSEAKRYGLVLHGSQRFEVGDFALALHLGLPPALDPGWGEDGRGVGLMLLDLTDASEPCVDPVIRLGGFGAMFGRKDKAKPLVAAGGFQLGAAGGYIAADIALTGAGAPKLRGDIQGALELDGLGMMFAPGGDGGNAVAASLLQSGDSGDTSPANPPFDLMLASSPTGFAVRFSGEPTLRIDIRKQFGPLYLAEIDLMYQEAKRQVGVGLTATVALAGLKVQADGLSLYVPINHPAEMDKWDVDVSGLSVSYQGSSVSISGGLLKAKLATTVEYRGSLAVEVAGRGLSAIGAYARPTDQGGEFTSLFIFLAISAPLGGPPYLFVTGVAGGAGLNRRLLTPRDPAQVPSFPLVQAMSAGGSADPMEQLARIGTDIPPERGAFWLAAGVRFSTFELLRTTALLTVAIDRGFEVSLLGLMQLRLPPADDATIISVELALAAKYSTVDQVLSVRAALTDNSWLLSRDCQLTGGFAFVVWFNPQKPEVLLTVGGYSSLFTVPDYYPAVPRVGFHWNVAEGIVVKGESFFAITHSAAMTGAALSASYQVGPVRAWFAADLDVIIWWDPFHYQLRTHVEVGVEIKVVACLFDACVTLPSLGFTLGVWLYLEGPPLSGLVVIDVGVAKFEVPFGKHVPQDNLGWTAVRVKYLGGGDQTAAATSASVAGGGVCAPLPAPAVASGPSPGAAPSPQPADGSEQAPFHVAPEFALRVESKMPLTSWQAGDGVRRTPAFAPASVDVVPAGADLPPVRASMVVRVERQGLGGAWTLLTPAEMAGLDTTMTPGRFPGAVWDGGIKTHDAEGHDTVDTSREMLTALGSVELNSAVAVSEGTGTLADLAVSGWVEEEAPRPLSFGEAGETLALPVQLNARTLLAGQGRVLRSVARGGVAAPAELRSQLAPWRSAAARGRVPASGSTMARGAALTEAGPALRAASPLEVWRVPATHAHWLAVSGAARRVTGLSSTGAVMIDRLSTDAGCRVPAGVRGVVVSDAHAGGTAGWALSTPLAQIEGCTLLAPGATLTLPRAWTPRPGRLRPGYPRWVDAADVTAEIDGIVTRFPIPAGGSGPTTLLVRLDQRSEATGIDEVRVDARGGVLSERRVFSQGSRVDLLYRVDLMSGMLVATVRTGPGWRLAGVLAGRNVDAGWAEALGAGTPCRILPAVGNSFGPGLSLTHAADVSARTGAASTASVAQSASSRYVAARSDVDAAITLTALEPGATDEQ
jgi:hypothetical protein